MTDYEVPDLIAINHDEYHARLVGITSDGRQFIITCPFVPATNCPGSEYLALYLFSKSGDLIDSKIHDFGPRSTLDDVARDSMRQKWLNELGKVEFTRIQVAPFKIVQYNTEFGLIVREPDDEDDIVAVEMQPGNFMAFFEPWDSGDYDT